MFEKKTKQIEKEKQKNKECCVWCLCRGKWIQCCWYEHCDEQNKKSNPEFK